MRNDRDKIVAWRLELNRIPHVFNVSPIVSPLTPLISRSQTELAINTHTAISDIRHDVVNTRNIVSDIHRTIVKYQDCTHSRNLSVSYHCTLPFAG